MQGRGKGWLVYVAVLPDFASKLETSAALLIRQRPGLVSKESSSRQGSRLNEGLQMLGGVWQKLLRNHRPGFLNLYGNFEQSVS